MVADKFGYEVGLFNGTGSSVNTATKTLSDDWHIPSLLYAGRFTYMPKGVMPSTQGNPNRLNEDKIMFGVSASINVESENESTNDTRVGVEFAMLKNKLYLGAEAYYMNVGFTDRQKINESYNYWVVMYRAATLLLPVCRLPCVMTSLTVTVPAMTDFEYAGCGYELFL